MVINKTYNIEQLKDELGEKIECARGGCTGAAVVDVIVAQEILEVLEEMLRRERRNQTLESAITFIEKEDGTHTNSMEEANRKPECFGMLRNNDTWNICEECPYIEQCKVVTEHE